MGYDVHITRKEDWFDEDGPDISLSEWKEYVQSDQEMRLDNFAETQTSSGSTLRIENEGLAVWTAYSGHGQNGNMAWFDYRNGNVTVKNPDEEILDKMVDISGVLSAKVQGDEGELYPITEVSVTQTEGLFGTSPYLVYMGIGLLISLVLLWFLFKKT